MKVYVTIPAGVDQSQTADELNAAIRGERLCFASMQSSLPGQGNDQPRVVEFFGGVDAEKAERIRELVAEKFPICSVEAAEKPAAAGTRKRRK